MNNKKTTIGILGFGLLVTGGYIAFRNRNKILSFLNAREGSSDASISDQEGHYDIDGVSFAENTVFVGSAAR